MKMMKKMTTMMMIIIIIIVIIIIVVVVSFYRQIFNRRLRTKALFKTVTVFIDYSNLQSEKD